MEVSQFGKFPPDLGGGSFPGSSYKVSGWKFLGSSLVGNFLSLSAAISGTSIVDLIYGVEWSGILAFNKSMNEMRDAI